MNLPIKTNSGSEADVVYASNDVFFFFFWKSKINLHSSLSTTDAKVGMSLMDTCNENRTPVHGSDICEGSNCVTTSNPSLNLLI